MNKPWSVALTLVWASAMQMAISADSAPVPAYIKAAVAEPTRPDRDVQRDPNRLPAQVIAFAGVKPGQNVVELMAGGGYFTRILCKIVGDSGHVTTVDITPTVKRTPPPASATDAKPAPPPPNPCTNISTQRETAADFALPAGVDVVWTSENYHDLHNAMFGSPDMKAFDAVIFKALKPGGVFIVEDHAAQTGSGARDTQTLHRIDPEQVKQEVTSVGFVLDSSSDLLRNPADAHTARVFDMPGKTDKMLFKFRKPAL